jgi:thiamine biosynthesis lipoprotein ApbE
VRKERTLAKCWKKYLQWKKELEATTNPRSALNRNPQATVAMQTSQRFFDLVANASRKKRRSGAEDPGEGGGGGGGG